MTRIGTDLKQTFQTDPLFGQLLIEAILSFSFSHLWPLCLTGMFVAERHHHLREKEKRGPYAMELMVIVLQTLGGKMIFLTHAGAG